MTCEDGAIDDNTLFTLNLIIESIYYTSDSLNIFP